MAEQVDPMAYLAKLREEFPELEGIDAEAAIAADRAAESARRINERDYRTGAGTPPLDVVQALLGTPTGDEYAASFGLEMGDFSTDQIQAMRRNGLSWQEIAARATGRRKIAG